MKSVLAAFLLLTLVACGTDTGQTATDPNSPVSNDDTPSDGGSSPTATGDIPAAPGIVGTRDLVTVMDTGSPELCLGAVAESYPPQCSGLPLVGWSWKDQDGVFEQQGDVRWGTFMVTGTFDGTTFTVASAIPGALYDPGPVDDPEPPTPGGDNGAAGPDEDKILEALNNNPLPGTLTVSPTAGSIIVDVVYDDGSIQEYATATYGDRVVTVSSALVDIQR